MDECDLSNLIPVYNTKRIFQYFYNKIHPKKTSEIIQKKNQTENSYQ